MSEIRGAQSIVRSFVSGWDAIFAIIGLAFGREFI